jgi:hypothetical protein
MAATLSAALLLIPLVALPAGAAAPSKAAAKPGFSAALASFQKDPSASNREAVIAAARLRKAAPAVPEEAERRMTRGAAAMKAAASPAELKEAAGEFEAAANAAPWLADAYYNAGVAYAKAGEHALAAQEYRLYVSAAATAEEAKDGKAKLYEEEFLAEKAAKAGHKLEGTWTEMSGEDISLVMGKHLSDWRCTGSGGGRYTLDLITFMGDPTGSRKTFELSVDGDSVSGKYSWDGRAPGNGRRLCDAMSSPVTGKLERDGKVLRVKYHTSLPENGCGDMAYDNGFLRLE